LRQSIAKLFWPMWGTIILLGCGVPGVPKPPSLELPQPITDLHAIRKGDRVYLVWTIPSETTDRLPVRHMGPARICRGVLASMTDCNNPAGEVPAPQWGGADAPQATSGVRAARMQETFTDILSPDLLGNNPEAKISYAISVPNANGRSAGLSNVVQVPGMFSMSPPAGFRAQVTAEGIVLRWAGIQNDQRIPALRILCRIYRRRQGGKSDAIVGEVPFDQGSATQLADRSFEWEETYTYRATTVIAIHEEGKPETQFESEDSPEVTVLAHDVFPPAVPSGLQAVFSGAGQPLFVDLIWAPDAEPDLAGYNIFRHEPGTEPAKINSELSKTPAFRDRNVVSGKMYFYSISAVDVRGNESVRSQEASEAVP